MVKPIVLIALLASGCATATDIYAAGVDETAVIKRPLDDVSQCMTLRMGAAPAVIDGRPTFMIGNGMGSNIGMISLSPVTEGTLVEIRRRGGTVSTGMWRDCR